MIASCLGYGTGSYADPSYVQYDKPLETGNLEKMRLQELLPVDAIVYVNAFESCQHWGGEEAYSPERGKDIQQGAERDCAASEALKKKIYRKYPRNSAVRKQLEIIINDGIESKFLWNDPEMKSEALRVYYESTAQDLVRTTAFMLHRHSSTNEDKENIRRQESQIRFLLRQANRLHPVTKKQLEEAHNKIKTLCDGTLSCMKPPKTEIYNIHEYCRKNKSDTAVVTKIKQLGMKEDGNTAYLYHYNTKLRTDYSELVFRADPRTKTIHDITVSWSGRGDPLSYEEIQQLVGVVLPKRGAMEILSHQEADRTEYSVLGDKNLQHPNLPRVAVACAKDNYDQCWRLTIDCVDFAPN